VVVGTVVAVVVVVVLLVTVVVLSPVVVMTVVCADVVLVGRVLGTLADSGATPSQSGMAAHSPGALPRHAVLLGGHGMIGAYGVIVTAHCPRIAVPYRSLHALMLGVGPALSSCGLFVA